MYEQAVAIARQGIQAVAEFLVLAQRWVVSWIQGDDLTLTFVLAFVALVVLFVLVPNRRRY